MKRITQTVAILLIALASGAQALTTLTVDTDSSDGEPGTDGKYSTLMLGYATLPDPFTDDVVINCSGATNDTTPWVLNKATLNGETAHTLTINGDNTTGIFDDAKYQLVVGVATGIYVYDASDGTTLNRLQITGNPGNSYTGIYFANSAVDGTVTNCIVQWFSKPSYAGINMGTGSPRAIYNNVVHDCTWGIYLNQAGAEVYNNTIDDSTAYGIYLNRDGLFAGNVRNNLISDSGTADWYVAGTAGTLTTGRNFTSDATSPDDDCASRTITFVDDDATPDYHLAAAMNQKMKGLDLSGTFSVDVDGETRGWWDPGFDEISDATQPWSRATAGGLNGGINDGLN